MLEIVSFKNSIILWYAGIAIMLTGFAIILSIIIVASKKGPATGLFVGAGIGCFFAIAGFAMMGISFFHESPMGPTGGAPGGTFTVKAKESFGNEASATSSPEKTYANVGYGPLVNVDQMKKWVNTIPNKFTKVQDGSVTIDMPSDKFRSANGFIPPSIQFYPLGISNNTYNTNKYEEGRKRCMEACSATNCIGLQTEVPEVCSQQVVLLKKPTGPDGAPMPDEYGTKCGDNATHSCTLFYNNVSDADDAYWTINDRKCLGPDPEGNKIDSCLGRKYFDLATSPSISPTSAGTKPSESEIKWCPATLVPKTISEFEGNGCTCVDSALPCTDTRCCRMRELITTTSAKSQKPYFHLPIDTTSNQVVSAFAVKFGIIGAITERIPEACCGKCGDVYKSCPMKKCENNTDSNCWRITTSDCSGNPFDKESPAAKQARDAYVSQSDPKDYRTNLMKSCYYKNLAIVGSVRQPHCGSGVEFGCFGSPPIINTDIAGTVSPCSNNQLIPPDARCTEHDKGVCYKFPYSCGSVGGSNRTWIPTS